MDVSWVGVARDHGTRDRHIVGAGTILNARQFDEAAAAGSKFIVSPGCTRQLFDAARDSAVQDIEATREWQRLIPDSTLEALTGDSPHLAATHPDECARRVRRFIDSARRG